MLALILLFCFPSVGTQQVIRPPVVVEQGHSCWLKASSRKLSPVVPTVELIILFSPVLFTVSISFRHLFVSVPEHRRYSSAV